MPSMILLSAIKTFTYATFRYYASTTACRTPTDLLHFLQLSIDHHSLRLIQQTHARILSQGFQQNVFLNTKLVSAYATCGTLIQSRLVFESIELKNAYLWNSLINGYVKNHVLDEAFELFCEMCRGNVLPDDYTLATLAKVSGEVKDLVAGRLVHGKSVRIGFVSDTVLSNSLMSMYGKCGELFQCRKLFDEMPEKSVGSWNVVITGYANSERIGLHKELWEFFRKMQTLGLKPDSFTVASLLPLCSSNTGKWDYGRELHCYLVKNELDLSIGSDVHMGSSLIDMYSKSAKVVSGRRVFDLMTCRNIYVWTAMINGYVQNGAPYEAFVLFHQMQMKDGIQPNKVSLVSVLPSCSSLAGLIQGKQIHGYAIRMKLNHDISLCNALIDMYSKCGSLDYARRIFDDGSFSKDAISWSSMISAYGLHGRGEEAVSMFHKMLQLGTKPDMVTVVGVLSACSKSGLVCEGLNIYTLVMNNYGIKPTVEICACVVDMLGRSGQLYRALDFIGTMPIEPGPSVWGALVSASEMHGNSETRDLAYRFLVELEPKNPSNYVSLSNLYAASRRWDNVAEVRTTMKERGLRKAPGCSWITINSMTHCFFVADKAHPSCYLIYEMLDDLIIIMKGTGHPHDIDIDILT
ncbi:Pentatricopeptide repeat-containing protein [Quillaja saponaria]|uniref:Pentatricopeptide repeat-containing protein n=1 Tax=Quillaja saponaria TaxID=32244 RepID=A0AAD7VL85_QUISA|nr:Pentatricopeptide repeat-containing protein [Quillaja saponaria]